MEKNDRGAHTTNYSAPESINLMDQKKDTSFAAYSKKPVEEWTLEEVVEYAQNFLDFDSDETIALQNAKLNGRRLLRVPSLEKLESYGLVGGAVDLWAEIEKLKKSAGPSSQLTGTISTSVELNRRTLAQKLDTLIEMVREIQMRNRRHDMQWFWMLSNST